MPKVGSKKPKRIDGVLITETILNKERGTNGMINVARLRDIVHQQGEYIRELRGRIFEIENKVGELGVHQSLPPFGSPPPNDEIPF